VLIVGGQAAAIEPGGAVASYTRPDNEFIAPWGAFTAVHFALVAQQYIARYQPDRELIASIAAQVRNVGGRNPRALMYGRGPYTAQDVLNSPPIVDPLTLLDLCLTNEGAAAMVITSLERARSMRKPPIALLGGGAEWRRQQYVDPARYDDVWMIGSDAARRAYETSGLQPKDIDVLEVYDANTYEIVRCYEALGFCGAGEGPGFAAAAGIGIDGKLPTNTDGGLLSFGHIGWGAPTLKIVEAVRQLRGEAGELQVKGARHAMATGAGSGAQYANVLIMART
jgi:acetyl-CoA acetyltransferase